MATITLELPESLALRAGWAAKAVHRPVGDVITAMLDGVLPSLDDVPAYTQAELVEMTRLDDTALLAIAEAAMSGEEKQRLAELSQRDSPCAAERAELDALRIEYSKLTLRKARALGALGLVSTSGQPSTHGSNSPLTWRNAVKNRNCPSGVTAPSGSHSTCTRPAKVSTATGPAAGTKAVVSVSPVG